MLAFVFALGFLGIAGFGFVIGEDNGAYAALVIMNIWIAASYLKRKLK